MDGYTMTQLTWTLTVICLVLTSRGEGNDLAKQSSCTGDCLQNLKRILSSFSSSSASSSSSSSRTRRQTVEVRDPPSHTLPCTTKEKKKTACLNGECYALDLGHLREAFCKCPAKWRGDRCEELSLDYFLLYSAEFQKAMIIGGVIIGLVIIIVAISLYCSFRKGRKKRQDSKGADGNTGSHEKEAMV